MGLLWIKVSAKGVVNPEYAVIRGWQCASLVGAVFGEWS
jgi:hypothetical protein